MDWNWKEWARAAGIRAVKTLAQTAIATIGTSMALCQVDWKLVASASVLAAVLSLLTSLAGLPELGMSDPLDEVQERAERRDYDDEESL